MAESFEEFIARERQRLDAEQAEIASQIKALEGRLAGIQRERSAVTAYEDAKHGRSAPRQVQGATGQRRARRGSRREELLNLIRGAAGLTRGDILEKLGLKGNKSGEMSVSNALTALTKSNVVRRDGGKYHPG